MRRLFRRDLLVTSPPSPRPRKERKKKNPSPKCLALMGLFEGYAAMMVVEFDVEILAREVGVLVSSARRWSYGYPPHNDLLWPIARYYAPRMQEDEKRVHAQMVQILKQWRNQ